MYNGYKTVFLERLISSLHFTIFFTGYITYSLSFVENVIATEL